MTSQQLFARAQGLLPGGVNSPVRAFRAVGGSPLFIKEAKGAAITDVEGNTYIDYVGSWGPMLLGHAHPKVLAAVTQAAARGLSFGAPCELELELAELVLEATSIEMVRMVNSGTEAVMGALRLARGYTGRERVIKFAGCYHGHADSMLVRAGSGALTGGVPDSAGVPAAVAAETLTATYNDLDSVEFLLKSNPDNISAVIVEPVAANMGVVPPAEGFLAGLRTLCDQYGALLIFDEVITGFRLAPGGAQEYFGVQADLVTYGKIIGGGMPVGAYGGRREIMEQVAPLGPVYQAGTLSGNPVAMAAGLAQLHLLLADKSLYTRLADMTSALAAGLARGARQAGIPLQVRHIGSLCCAFFTGDDPTNYDAVKTCDTARYAAFFREMLSRGIYLAPSQFEAMFVGAAHTPADIHKTMDAATKSLQAIAGKDL